MSPLPYSLQSGLLLKFRGESPLVCICANETEIHKSPVSSTLLNEDKRNGGLHTNKKREKHTSEMPR